MKAIVLAAGYATRLYPLTKDYPKPLLEVGSRPIISYIIDKLCGLDKLDEIFVVTNSKFYSFFQKWKDGLRCAVPIVIIDDLTSTKESRRGAIGDMHFVIQATEMKDDVIVVGADNLFDADLGGFITFAQRKRGNPAIGVYDIHSRADARHYGVISLDKNRRITDFHEKPEHPDSSLIAMCVYFFPQERIGLVQDYVQQHKGHNDAIGLYIDWLRKKETVYGYIFEGKWFDIGHQDTLKEAKREFIE